MTAKFETQPFEAQALCLTAALAGKPLPLKLKPEDRQQVERLLQALKAGQKAKALQLSSAFYKQVLSPGAIACAYQQVRALNLNGNPDYQIVMDSLKDSCSQLEPDPKLQLSLDQALEILLLTITHSDKNSISYLRIDENTGKPRPTTFPLTAKLISHFLEPFGDKQALVEKVLIFGKISVIGNPAVLVVERYKQRRQAFEAQQAAAAKAQAEAAVLAQKQPSQPSSAPKRSPQAQEVEHVEREMDKMLEAAKAPEAQQAVLLSFQVRQLRELLAASKTPGDSFGQKLSAIYGQRLSPQQSAELSTRLASRMKRMMSRLGTWKDEYWQEYQVTMQQMGVWEGQAWLEKWRANKTGKQMIAKTGKDYLVEEKPETVNELLAKEQKRQDKLKGQHMLSQADISDWLAKAPAEVPRELQKVLEALSRPERVDDLVALAFEPQDWQTIPEVLQFKLYQLFSYLSHTDLDTLKSEMAKGLSGAELETAQKIIAQLELQINRMAALFKKDLKMTFPAAVEILTQQQEEQKAREKLNSKAFTHSPAGHYARYQL